MASATDISNIALSHLGARAQVSSISPPDGSVEAGYCARFYPLARREVLEAMNFSFAKTRVTLAEVTNTSTVWGYAYALPSDCIKALRVLKLEYAQQIALLWPIGYRYTDGEWTRIEDAFSERGSATFELEDQVLRTNEPDAVLLYKRDVTDTTKFSPLTVSAIGQVLAGYLAGPIIKGLDGARVGAQWREQGMAAARAAAASDANASNESSDHVPTHIAARL
jgi:hypothetical protein